ncbi:DeoR/GlpR family DNA-binding transcription regulator [Peribacillus kribbensis]|uniref:DeoR/GlpR family DNA-binding transcription regulator n=1 Tax=Peribacillus kribbensis TaxID=356658 RepID=UPI00040A96FB|nr:DeoR/GlpR family DNA-binding transcription regulator [Peribacillus kribbensis]
MLADERYNIILALLQENEIVKLADLIEQLEASEATLRRDLASLEKKGLLKRVHGGASLPKRRGIEPGLHEKTNKFIAEKLKIAKKAAEYISDEDCIYLDAGTTVKELIPFLTGKNVTVLTNGLMHLPLLSEAGIRTMIIGGQVKTSTNAIVGSTAVSFIRQYRFDKCFLGMNAVHPELGYTTPDPDEALLKRAAIELSREAYVLADSSKLNDSAFAKVADMTEAVIITDANDESILRPFRKNSHTKVVTA